MRTRLNLDINHIYESYLAGESVISIAERLGCSITAVRNRLILADAPIRNLKQAGNNRRRKINEGELFKLYESGISVLAMSKQLGVSRSCILNRLSGMGLAIRSGSEANTIRFARASVDERKSIASAANLASRSNFARNVPQNEPARKLGDHLSQVALSKAIKTALTRMNGSVAQTHELPIWEMLREFSPQVQFPVGPYNIDLAIGSVAVEVHAARYVYEGHRRLATRSVQILDEGWSVLVVWITDGLPDPNHLISTLNHLRGLPTGRSEYWVVRSDSEPYSVTRDDLNAFAVPPRARD
jgi:hypothetical protein